MMTFVYKDHEIHYDELTDEWSCPDWRLRNTALSKLKAAVDRKVAALRKANTFPCFTVPARDGHMSHVEIVGYIGPTTDFRGRPQEAVNVILKRGNHKPERMTKMLADLCLLTPENEALLEQARTLDAQAYALRKKGEELRMQITPLTRDDIQKLIDAQDALQGGEG